MKKTLEFLFLAFCALFTVFGIKFLVTSIQPDPIAVETDRETQAIQEQLNAMTAKQAVKQPEQSAKSNNSYCQKVASELASTGQLADLSRNPSCVNWAVPINYSKQNDSAISDIKESTKKEAVKYFDQQFNLIKATYLDQEALLTSKYNRTVQQRNIDYNNSQITIGQYNYFLSTDKAQYLDKVISNKEKMLSALNAEISKHVNISELYAKYQIPKEAGSETLTAIANSASASFDKKALILLASYKNSSDLDNLRTQSTDVKQKFLKKVKDENREVRMMFFRQFGYFPPDPLEQQNLKTTD